MALQGIILANDTTRSAPEKKLGPIPDVLMSIGAVFMAVLGIAAQFGVMAAYRRGDMHIAGAILLFAFGVMLAGVGLWGLYERFVTTPRRHARLARIEALHPGAPWMLNEAWDERKVVDRSGATVAIFLWIWSAGWAWPLCSATTIGGAAGCCASGHAPSTTSCRERGNGSRRPGIFPCLYL